MFHVGDRVLVKIDGALVSPQPVHIRELFECEDCAEKHRALVDGLDDDVPLSALTLAPTDGATHYDLLPEQEVELKDVGTMTLKALAERADEDWVSLHGRIFRPDSKSFSVITKMTPSGLLLWDTKTRVSHRLAHLKVHPEVLAPLLEAVAAADDGTMFGKAAPPPVTHVCEQCRSTPDGSEQASTFEGVWLHERCKDAFIKAKMREEGIDWEAPKSNSRDGAREPTPPPPKGPVVLSRGLAAARNAAMSSTGTIEVEFTAFDKAGGSLTKHISIGPDNKPVSDGSACRMSRGRARRVRIGSLDELAALIESLTSKQAIALGPLRDGLPDEVDIVTKRKVVAGNAAIARTAANLGYRPGKPAFTLLDYDTKGMPAPVKQTLDAKGGFWPALVSVLPALKSVGYLLRLSTSAGLYRTDTGERFPGSGGLHAYPRIASGGDAVRFLKALHERCWNAGFGWYFIGAAGQLLERSIVDRMVGAPERLVFEGPPILEAPLAQDAAARKPTVVDGDVLDTLAACPPLSIVEQTQFDELRAKEKERLRPEMAKVRDKFIATEVKRLVARGKPEAAARKTVERWADGVLYPDVALEFDEEELAGCTVGDILDDPARFEGATLADPVEGSSYGWCKAKVMRRAGGQPFIHSLAHGGGIYELRYSAESISEVLAAIAKEEVVATLAKRAVQADLDAVEAEALRRQAHKKSGVGLNAIKAVLKEAQQEQAAQDAQQKQAWRAAQRQDWRPYLRAPYPDEPWLPQMKVLNSVIGKVVSDTPPARDRGGTLTWVRKIPFLDMHIFTDGNSPEGDDE